MSEQLSDEHLTRLSLSAANTLASARHPAMAGLWRDIHAALCELQRRRAAENEGARVGSVYDHLAFRFGGKGNPYGRGG